MINQQMLEGGRELGIDFTSQQLLEFQMYHDAVMLWKDWGGLVSRNDLDRIVSRHFLDSLTPIPVGMIPETGSLVDIGSGAGFPGIPLAICKRGISMGLIESNRKKAGFMRYVVKTLGLDDRVSVHLVRAETFASDLEKEDLFDLAVSRAVGTIGLLVSLGAPLLKPGGALLLYKGVDIETEMNAAEDILSSSSCVLDNIYRLPASFSTNKCSLVVLRKNSLAIN